MLEEAFIRLRLSRLAAGTWACGTVGACNHVDKAFVTRVPLVPGGRGVRHEHEQSMS